MLMRKISACLLVVLLFACLQGSSQPAARYKVIAFFTAREDLAHISFVHEANRWFAAMAIQHHFTYDSTNDWNNLNADFLKNYQVVLFLDTRPDSPAQRAAFQKYMEGGGGWMGFHFSAFGLTPSDYPQNWDWYHEQFLGSGQYVSNTWRPTTAILKKEDKIHPAVKNMPATFKACPNEWYRWEHDLRKNPDIDILFSIDSSSFPLGTGPKQDEIWHSGYYPVVWSNSKYKMIYCNMGHNDMDYENRTNKELSSTFASPDENKFFLDALDWLGKSRIKY